MTNTQAPSVKVIEPMSPVKLLFARYPDSALASVSMEFISLAGIPYKLTQVIVRSECSASPMDRPELLPSQYEHSPDVPYAFLILTQGKKAPDDLCHIASKLEMLSGGRRETINHSPSQEEIADRIILPSVPDRFNTLSLFGCCALISNKAHMTKAIYRLN